jgi:hypothetical protein
MPCGIVQVAPANFTRYGYLPRLICLPPVLPSAFLALVFSIEHGFRKPVPNTLRHCPGGSG